MIVKEFKLGRSYPLIPASQPAVFPLSLLSSANTSSSLEKQVLLILPLLIETWVEAKASSLEVTKDSVLPKEVGELLAYQAGILDKLVRLMDGEVSELIKNK